MIGDTLLQAFRGRNRRAPSASGVVLLPSGASDPGDNSVTAAEIALLYRYCPVFVIHEEGEGGAVAPFPRGRHDYHPRDVERYIAGTHLLAEQGNNLARRYGGRFGRWTITVRDGIVRFSAFVGLWRVGPLRATFAAWLLVTIGVAIGIFGALPSIIRRVAPGADLGFLIGPYAALSVVTLLLCLFPFAMERFRRWPTGIEEIRSAIADGSDGLPNAVMTPVAVLDERRLWETYKKAPKPPERVVYARLAPGPGSWLIAEYWLFYVFNNWLNNHDGDWEMAALFLPSLDAPPEFMFCTSHEGGTWRRWVDAHPMPGHPNRRTAYVARGSHAMYFEPVPGGHRPTHLVPLSNIPLFGRNLAVRFIADSGNQRDWVPPVEPSDLGSTPTYPIEVRVMPAHIDSRLEKNTAVWNRWWWLRFEGSWSRCETILGPRWQRDGAKWERLGSFIRAEGVSDTGPFTLT